MQQKTLVVAANGRVASRVLARLSAAGLRPKALVRDGDKARTVLTDRDNIPLYEELIIAELTDRDALESALTDVDIAFLALGSSPDQIDLEKAVIDAAKAVSLPHLVKLSAANASHDAVASVLRVHAEIEDHLRASGVAHTLISPTTFMDIAFIGAASIRSTQSWFGTAPDGLNALVDSDDVVDAVVSVISDSSKRGGTHLLTGPTALSWPDVADALTVLLSRPITYNAVSVEQRRTQLEGAGLADWRVELLLGIDELNRHSVYAEPNDTVHALTGRQPHTLSEFLQRHREVFEVPPPAAAPS